MVGKSSMRIFLQDSGGLKCISCGELWGWGDTAQGDFQMRSVIPITLKINLLVTNNITYIYWYQDITLHTSSYLLLPKLYWHLDSKFSYQNPRACRNSRPSLQNICISIQVWKRKGLGFNMSRCMLQNDGTSMDFHFVLNSCANHSRTKIGGSGLLKDNTVVCKGWNSLDTYS